MITHAAEPYGDEPSEDQRTKRSDSHWLAQLADPATRETAAAAIHRRYEQQLLHRIENQLSESLQQRVDPPDVMQSVWRSFFSRRFELRDTDSLLPLLAEMCVNKAISAARRHTAQMRSVDSEATDFDVATCEAMLKGATPEQAAIAIELLESLPVDLQEIMSLKLEGYHDEEIGQRLGCTRRTVVRKTELLRSHLRSRMSDDQ